MEGHAALPDPLAPRVGDRWDLDGLWLMEVVAVTDKEVALHGTPTEANSKGRPYSWTWSRANYPHGIAGAEAIPRPASAGRGSERASS